MLEEKNVRSRSWRQRNLVFKSLFWFFNVSSVLTILLIILLDNLHIATEYSQYWGLIPLLMSIISTVYDKYYAKKHEQAVDTMIASLPDSLTKQQLIKELKIINEPRIKASWYGILIIFDVILLTIFLIVLFTLEQNLEFHSNIKLEQSIEISSASILMFTNYLLNLNLKNNPRWIKIKTTFKKYFLVKTK